LRLERAILEKNALDKVAPEIVFQSKDGAIFSSIAKLMMFYCYDFLVWAFQLE
jgi:hypothetical protein